MKQHSNFHEEAEEAIDIHCPFCPASMEYSKHNNVHIWKCPECPAILKYEEEIQ